MLPPAPLACSRSSSVLATSPKVRWHRQGKPALSQTWIISLDNTTIPDSQADGGQYDGDDHGHRQGHR